MSAFSMRLATALAPLLLLGCATSTLTPREYLDETTAATITAVAEPWIFVSERSQAAAEERDFLSVYAIDVNRMGDHRQYLAVLQWWPDASARARADAVLELHTAQRTILLQPTAEEARKLGLAQPLVASYTPDSKWWYFSVDKNMLASLAGSRDLRTTFAVGESRTAYTMWRDGSAELSELTAVLP